MVSRGLLGGESVKNFSKRFFQRKSIIDSSTFYRHDSFDDVTKDRERKRKYAK